MFEDGNKKRSINHYAVAVVDFFWFKMPSCFGSCSVKRLHFRFSTYYRRKTVMSTVRAFAGRKSLRISAGCRQAMHYLLIN